MSQNKSLLILIQLLVQVQPLYNYLYILRHFLKFQNYSILQNMLANKFNKGNIKFYQVLRASQQGEEENNKVVQYANPISSNQNMNVLELQTITDEYIDLETIFQYSKRNAFVAQQFLIEPNYEPPHRQDYNLKQSRELQAQSPKVSRPFFINPSIQQLQNNQTLKNEQCLQKIQTQQSKDIKNNFVESEDKAKCLSPKDEYQEISTRKRISINIGPEVSKSKHFNIKNEVIPLRMFDKSETMAINTYRFLKHKYENEIEMQKQLTNKKKSHKAKKQQSRFKGMNITYDYDGEPIPLKSFKKYPVPIVVQKKPDSVTMIPLAENIVLPSSIHRKRLEKRKARYLNQDQEKQNKRKHHFEDQNIICEETQFIKRTPNNIQKWKLFQDKKESAYMRKNMEEVTLAQFKSSKQKSKTTKIDQVILIKSQKKQLINISEAPQKSLKVVSQHKTKEKKQVYHSQGKVVLNQRVFEEIFNIKPNTYKNNDKLKDKNICNLLHTYHEKNRDLKPNYQPEENKHWKRPVFAEGVMPFQCDKRIQQYKEFCKGYEHEKTSIFRASLQNSPNKKNSCEQQEDFKSLRQSKIKIQQKHPICSLLLKSKIKKQMEISRQTEPLKSKLKRRPSSRQILVA